jgi:Transposase DDE domain
MQAVFHTRANELAWETGFMERERVLTGSSFLVGLVSAWQANPRVSLAGMSQAIGNAGTPISRQGVEQRFDARAVSFLKAMVDESLKVMVKGTPVDAGILARFSAVELTDSSSITLPNRLQTVWRGSGGFGAQASTAAVKVSVRWNMRDGALQTVSLSDGIRHDTQSPAHQDAVRAGSLQIKDLGYFNLEAFEKIGQQGAYWLTRYKIGTGVVDEQGQEIDLETWLPQTVGQRLDVMVRLGKQKQLPCRLVAERVPPEIVQQRHQRIGETARQNQTEPSQRALALAQWTIYLTNVPETLLNTEEVFIMGRYRWQIELLFKLWKSDLQIDDWNSTNPDRILCEFYGKLIAAIVTHWFLLMGCWDNPRRSLRQAIPTIRGLAWQWANSLSTLARLKHMLRALCRSLSHCSMDRSQSTPRHFQLLELEFA